MASIKFYLDTRSVKKNGEHPIKLLVSHNNKSSMLSTGVSVKQNQWENDAQRIVSHPMRNTYNNLLATIKLEAEDITIELSKKGMLKKLTAKQLRDKIANRGQDDNPTLLFGETLIKFASNKSTGTKRIYTTTYNKLCAYCDISTLTFDDIDKEWITNFDEWMKTTAPAKNSRNIHLRNIRAVFNYAIDEELITHYPFRKIKIRREPTRKRALSVDSLRELFNYPVEEYQVKYLEIFKLIFFLIGINIADLTHLKTITADGRVEYNRAKTHKPYSIKVEPEAMAIIEKYKGKDWLINPLDTWKNYINYVQHCNRALQNIGRVTFHGTRHVKTIEPLFPKLSTYWARHTWATIAASLDIPKETIAHALGHGSNTVTDIYIDFDMKKVDEANRRVIDWVLYGKR